MGIRAHLWRRAGLAAAMLAAALLLAGAAGAQPKPPAPSKQELPDTWYAQALAHSPVGINVTHFWAKGNKLRAETVIAGHRIITIVTDEHYLAYDLVGRRGVAVLRSDLARKQDAGRSRPFGNELSALRRQGAEKVREEKLGGRKVELYQVTDEQGRRRVWATMDELHLPLRIEIYRRSDKQTLTTDFLNWQRGIPIPDEFFLPESAIVLETFTYEEYVQKQADREAVGPVPVLYTDLLHGY